MQLAIALLGGLAMPRRSRPIRRRWTFTISRRSSRACSRRWARVAYGFQPMSASRSGGNPLFHPGQSVEILAGKDVAGYFGLMHPGKSRDLKARAPLWLAQLDWEAIAKLSRPATEAKKFRAWPEFPAIERDFALVVKNTVTSDKITQLALKVGKPLAKIAKVFDIYRGSQVAEGMTSVAVRVIFYEETRSLQETEAENASNQILEAWKKELGAELRG